MANECSVNFAAVMIILWEPVRTSLSKASLYINLYNGVSAAHVLHNVAQSIEILNVDGYVPDVLERSRVMRHVSENISDLNIFDTLDFYGGDSNDGNDVLQYTSFTEMMDCMSA